MGEYSPDAPTESAGFERGPPGPQGTPGETGATGATGAMGLPGPAGPNGSAAYVETFAAASVWIVNHNLGRHPHTWAVESLASIELEVAVQHVSPNQSRVYFDLPVAGVVRFT